MTHEEKLFKRHRGKSVLLDSNLLLVLLAGSAGIHLFKSLDRVKDYTIADYELLVWLISHFLELTTTPHILTEVSNLANKLSGSHRNDWYTSFAAFVSSGKANPVVDERWIPAQVLTELPEFTVYGITDSIVTKFASNLLIVTADYRLSGVLRSKGLSIINFRDLRALQRAIQ